MKTNLLAAIDTAGNHTMAAPNAPSAPADPFPSPSS